MYWMLESGALALLKDARRVMHESRSHGHDARLVAGNVMSNPPMLRVAGSTVEIRIEGVLTRGPDLVARMAGLGNTTYEALGSAIANVAADNAITSVELYVDSPGGQVDGLFAVLEALEDLRMRKRVRVRAANAMSAAYGIAAVAGEIEATNYGARFGSIGIVAAFFVDGAIVDITNTDSPDKRPEVKTPEGAAVVRRELDAIHDLFVASIARGRRSVTAQQVREDFGRGATLLAGQAMQRGMIDLLARTDVVSARSVAQAESRGCILQRAREDVAMWRAMQRTTSDEQAAPTREQPLSDEQLGHEVARRLFARNGLSLPDEDSSETNSRSEQQTPTEGASAAPSDQEARERTAREVGAVVAERLLARRGIA